MICDDEADVLMAYKIALSSKYSIVTAISGQDCLTKYNDEQLQGRKVDVLILDYKLGDMLGDEVACKIQEMDGTKVILISAYEIDPEFLKDSRTTELHNGFHKKAREHGLASFKSRSSFVGLTPKSILELN